MTRRRIAETAGGVILVVVALFAAAVFWLFYDNPLPTSGSFVIDIPQLRALAARGPGPTRIEVEEVSHSFNPKIGVVAGTNWRPFDMVRTSYRLVYPGGSVVLDSGYPPAVAKRAGVASYDSGAWSRIQRALVAASTIIVTHEHIDHLGGIMGSPALAAILPKTRLTPEQIADRHPGGSLHWPAGSLRGYRPLRYRDAYAVAPGVVLIRAPGHTPGSQMVYVRRADGREFLFMGDVASAADNVRLQRMRPRYTTMYYSATHDDRGAVMLQTVALHRLHARYPDIVLVPGHDGIAIRALEQRKLLKRGFTSER